MKRLKDTAVKIKPTAILKLDGTILESKGIEAFGCKPRSLDGLNIGSLVGWDTWLEWANKLLERDEIEIPNTLAVVNNAQWRIQNKLSISTDKTLELIALEFERLTGGDGFVLNDNDLAIARWLDSLPSGVIPIFRKQGLPGARVPLDLADTLILKIPYSAEDGGKKSGTIAHTLQRNSDRVFALFPKVIRYQIIHDNAPLNPKIRQGIKKQSQNNNSMGKTTTKKRTTGLQQPRSKLLEYQPMYLNLFEHCTAAIHGPKGEILAIRPHLTAKRLFNDDLREIIGMPLDYLPNGIKDPIMEGIEKAKGDPAAYAMVRYEYEWDDFNWIFHVKFQHDRNTGETVRLTYDDMENKEQRDRQINYWLWKIARDPAIAYHG
jgi:hypothetical protein